VGWLTPANLAPPVIVPARATAWKARNKVISFIDSTYMYR
jgi:hypothetical protein